jgi:hypothetical protein
VAATGFAARDHRVFGEAKLLARQLRATAGVQRVDAGVAGGERPAQLGGCGRRGVEPSCSLAS